MQYAYVLVTAKPFGLLSDDVINVDAGVHLLMYQGTFTVADFATLIKPLGAGELVSLPAGTGSPNCISWRGMAARCIFRDLLLNCFGMFAHVFESLKFV